MIDILDGSDTLTELIERGNALTKWYWDEFGLSTPITTRVPNKDPVTLVTPQSAIQLFKKLDLVDHSTKLTYKTPLFWNLLALVICTATDPYSMLTGGQCTDNIWADMTLNGGDPGSESIYGYFNLYQWVGWVELLFWAFPNVSFEIIWEALGLSLYTAIVWYFLDIPMCRPGEVQIWGKDCATYFK